MPGALERYRIVDLTTDRGWLCGKILADLGAEVIKVDGPGGDPGRSRGHFVDSMAPSLETNLDWWFFNRGKKSIVIDLDDPAGCAELLDLLAGADAVVESYPRGGWKGGVSAPRRCSEQPTACYHFDYALL